MSENEIRNIFAEAKSKSHVLELLQWPGNGRSFRKLQHLIDQLDIDTSHFDKMWKNRKYKTKIKNCPVCGKEFIAKNDSREKTVCSYACSNKFFVRREPTFYTTICFNHHERKCVVCGETNVVAVHHYDGNKTNNDPKNLIPLCPTHHTYWHSKHRSKIEEVVKSYYNNQF